jgi:hypothetical protein
MQAVLNSKSFFHLIDINLPPVHSGRTLAADLTARGLPVCQSYAITF